MYGFHCCRRISGIRAWKKCADICHFAKNRSGDSGAVYIERAVPAVWTGLCAVCGGADTGGSSSGRAREAVQAAGGREGSGIRYGRVLKRGEKSSLAVDAGYYALAL